MEEKEKLSFKKPMERKGQSCQVGPNECRSICAGGIRSRLDEIRM